MVLLWDFWQEEWTLGHKVEFDGPNRLILIHPDIYALDVKTEIYSAWKEWTCLHDHAKYLPAMRSVGGDPTIGNFALGSTFFLINGWKIRPADGDYRIIISGNLYSEDGQSPFVPCLNPSNVQVQFQTSNLVDLVTVSTPVAALSQTEHDQLMAIPTQTLTTAEHDFLMALPTLTLTEAEHDALLNVVSNVRDMLIEGTLTLAGAMRILIAASAGKTAGSGSSTVVFRDLADSVNRIEAVLDGRGNRTSVVLTP